MLWILGLTVVSFVQGIAEIAILPAVTAVQLLYSATYMWNDWYVVSTG